jgi:hypothetical protein
VIGHAEQDEQADHPGALAKNVYIAPAYEQESAGYNQDKRRLKTTLAK